MDRIKKKILLDEIYKEFVFNREELNETVTYYHGVYNDCMFMRELFPIDPNDVNLDSVSQHLKRMHGNPSADLSMGSISTLVNSSSFEIIPDNELRSLLLQWQDLNEDYFDVEANTRTHLGEQFMPYLSQRIPIPFTDGIRDSRVDLSFMRTIEFENMIKIRQRQTRTILDKGGRGSKIENSINRIIQLTDTSQL